MKQITTILLTIIALSCSGQKPDTLAYYPVQYVDSIINNYEQRIANFQSILDTYDETEISVVSDTINFEVVDDRIKVEVTKEGHNVWIDLIDSDTIISMTYINYIRNVILSE